MPLALKVIEVDSEQFSKLPAVEIMEELQDLVRSASSDQRDNISAESDFRVVGGYDQVLAARATSLTIRTGTVVTEVLADASGVEVVTGQGTFTAQAVIVTVPAGVLQAESIVFDPPIPGDQAAAIAEVEYLPVFKGIMEFSEPVLPAGQDLVEDYSLQVPSFWNASAEITGYSGQVVVGWATGDNARRLRSLSEAAQRDTLTDALRVLTGNADIEPIAFVHHDWETDPFSRGSYPRHGIESALLYRPIAGRVFWAGMITDTIHHSADTGRRAAHSALHTLR